MGHFDMTYFRWATRHSHNIALLERKLHFTIARQRDSIIRICDYILYFQLKIRKGRMCLREPGCGCIACINYVIGPVAADSRRSILIRRYQSQGTINECSNGNGRLNSNTNSKWFIPNICFRFSETFLRIVPIPTDLDHARQKRTHSNLFIYSHSKTTKKNKKTKKELNKSSTILYGYIELWCSIFVFCLFFCRSWKGSE